jgi:hypothetical protein
MFSELRAACATIKITPRARTCIGTHRTLPRKAHEIQRVLLLDWQLKNSKVLPSLERLTVHRAHVEAAIKWLQLNNPFYEDIALDYNSLLQLPEDGLPDWIAQQVKDKTSESQWHNLAICITTNGTR